MTTKKERALQNEVEAKPWTFDALLKQGKITQAQYDAIQEYAPGKSKGRKLLPTDEGWTPEIHLHNPPLVQMKPPTPPVEKIVYRDVEVEKVVEKVVEKIVYVKRKPSVFFWFLILCGTPLLKVAQYYFGEWWVPDVVVNLPAAVCVLALCHSLYLKYLSGEINEKKTLAPRRILKN